MPVVAITYAQDRFIATGARHKLVHNAVTQNPDYKPLQLSVKRQNRPEGVRML
jgi:hypothetical protein